MRALNPTSRFITASIFARFDCAVLIAFLLRFCFVFFYRFTFFFVFCTRENWGPACLNVGTVPQTRQATCSPQRRKCAHSSLIEIAVIFAPITAFFFLTRYHHNCYRPRMTPNYPPPTVTLIKVLLNGTSRAL